MFKKLKSLLTDDAIFYTLLIIVVSVISFALGRFSVQTEHKTATNVPNVEPPISLVEAATTSFTLLNESTFQVVGSKSGTKYHLPTCPGASQMKAENKIFFDSVELAKAAGYTAAANCPGL